MKKILIALPMMLIMLLSMLPVMAAPKTIPVEFYLADEKEKISLVTFDLQINDADSESEAEKKAIEEIKKNYLPEISVPSGYELKWNFNLMPELSDKRILIGIKKDQVAMGEFVPYVETTLGMTLNYADDLAGNDLKVEGYIRQSAIDKVYAAFSEGRDTVTIALADLAGSTDPEEVYTGITFYIPHFPVVRISGSVYCEFVESSSPETPTSKPETTCPEACEFITVRLEDIYTGMDMSAFTKVFKVDKLVAPEYESILDLYLDQYFPWHLNWQPAKNFLNVYSIITPNTIYDCEIIIEVIPRWEHVMIIHELWDCCITPDGEVKEELSRSFVEDTQKYASWNPAYKQNQDAWGFETVMGTPDGVIPFDFLDFHTDLKVNQEKAAEYAKTRLEKMNAADFVFQHATFYENVRLSRYFQGEVYNMRGDQIAKFENGIPTIVIKYLRAECIKTDEKVDDAKVVAGQAGTTNTPVQQLPATGAKDVTAFFMSAVALLGLGIFFAKKR